VQREGGVIDIIVMAIMFAIVIEIATKLWGRS
jgi:hypothetical protein